MTASLFLLIACLLPLHVALGAEKKPIRRRVAVALACLALLPLTFGPFVPISHFIFESTSRTTLVVMQVGVVILLFTLAWRVTVRWKDKKDAAVTRSFTGGLFFLGIWMVSAILMSNYEQGVRTPDVWDAPIYVLDWLSAIFACGFLAIAAWHIAGSTVFSRLPVAGYVGTVATLIYGTFG